ncbi:hypothetical protein STRAU_6616 [Streptomyces aurantiacus JA 4570]|uniref:Helix-turn-helix domain-containing protein n=1 Tax=Streptomyces aurantiacus JA 4570 TaxID=1286094 RepID=S3ZB42_9ACTN|nr:hypothetical protein STRAU_6616 [Streptomyces aurantiacus JA 4570]
MWDHATARGTARTVLLAIADKANTDAVAYAGTAMLVQRTRAARSTVRDAVDALLDSGELAVVQGVTGPRGETVYHLPLVADHTRTDGAEKRSGPDSGPDRGPAPWGPESGTEEGWNPARGGAGTGPQNKKNRKEREAQQQPRANAPACSLLISELHPLGAALASAGVAVRWSLGLGEQRDVWRLVQQHGVEALVELAARRTQPGTEPKPARYWMRVWGDLNRAPSAHPGSNVVALRSPGPAAYTDNLAAGLALLKAQKEGTS